MEKEAESERYIRVSSVPCYNFTDENGTRRIMSAILAPLSFEEKGSRLIVGWACSLGSACHCVECHYSRVLKESVERKVGRIGEDW